MERVEKNNPDFILFLHYALCNNLNSSFLVQNANDKVFFIDEWQIYMGIALFFSTKFQSFCLNFICLY
jgi:hypothetical protein